MGGARGEVGEERPVGHERPLLADPGDGAIGQVLAQVVALSRCLGWLDWRRALEECRVVLVGLTTDESVEVVETTLGGPLVEGSHGARLPDRHLVALAELGGE